MHKIIFLRFAMNYENYLSLIINNLKNNLIFNISHNIAVNGMKIDLFADCFFLSNDTVKNKAVPFNKYEIREKYYLKCYEDVTCTDIMNFFSFLKCLSDDYARSEAHIQESIIGIIVGNSSDKNAKNLIESLNYSKPYSLYFKGWNEIQLILADLCTEKIYFNRAASKSSELFRFNILSHLKL